MLTFLYNLGLHLYLLASLPAVVWNYGKYEKSLWGKLGRDFPRIEKNGRPLIWVHAVSLGETRMVAPLVKQLRALPSHPQVLLTTSTATGYAEGERSLPEVEYRGYLPLDLPYLIQPIVHRVRPDYLILAESDIWPNFQNAVKEGGGKVILVNGKLSSRSFSRFQSLSCFAKLFFAPLDLLCVQNKLYEERFIQLGVPPEKIAVTGNIKLDTLVEKPAFTREDLGISQSDEVLVLGSTHAPEEEVWLKCLKCIWMQHPQLKIFIVPRHPERFDAVAALLEREKIAFTRFTEQKPAQVILVDKMGILRSLYAIADIAFVGGSFTEKVGGHNILEPCYYGVPVLYGPHMHTQPDLVELMRTYEAGVQITEKSLLTTLEGLLQSKEMRLIMGERGKRLVADARGALPRTLEKILPLINQ